MILASEAALTKHSLTPLARIVGYGVTGCDPTIMGIGPVSAINKLVKATGTQLGDVDLIEVSASGSRKKIR